MYGFDYSLVTVTITVASGGRTNQVTFRFIYSRGSILLTLTLTPTQSPTLTLTLTLTPTPILSLSLSLICSCYGRRKEQQHDSVEPSWCDSWDFGS